jgi:hypothetical protein
MSLAPETERLRVRYGYARPSSTDRTLARCYVRSPLAASTRAKEWVPPPNLFSQVLMHVREGVGTRFAGFLHPPTCRTLARCAAAHSHV